MSVFLETYVLVFIGCIAWGQGDAGTRCELRVGGWFMDQAECVVAQDDLWDAHSDANDSRYISWMGCAEWQTRSIPRPKNPAVITPRPERPGMRRPTGPRGREG